MSIAIIGTGIMGRGIAQVAISAGYETNLFDISKDALTKAKEEINHHLNRNVTKGKMSEFEKNDALEHLSLSDSLPSTVENSNILIECIPESLDLKHALITEIEDIKPQIIASNTSSISIDELASISSHPGNVIGMHFFNPPPVMKLVEIVVGKQTSMTTLSVIRDLAIAFGKEPIEVKDFPGFASSRLGVSLGLEAIRMVEQGVATPEDIDKAMTLGYRHPMGPLELTDYIGLDTRLKIAEYLNSTGISPSFSIPQLLRNMVAEGKLGRKSGQGFYEWEEGRKL